MIEKKTTKDYTRLKKEVEKLKRKNLLFDLEKRTRELRNKDEKR